MFRKILKRLGVGLLATGLVVGSFAIWAFFTQRKIDAREQEMHVAAREARERGHQAPQRDARADERSPAARVGEHAKRNAEDGADDGAERVGPRRPAVRGRRA